MKTLVIPSIREESLSKFFKKWILKDWDNVIVIEDNPERTFQNLNPWQTVCHRVDHFSWKEIDEELGKNAWIISRRDSAIRCFGFYMAHKMGANYIFTLDDDCYPEDLPFCDKHIQNLNYTTQWTESILGVRTRGLPYENKGHLPNIMANMGLWTGVPDMDAIHQFANTPEIEIPKYNKIIPKGQYAPLCGMNLCIKRHMIPASYFPLMGQNSPYARFDDMWFGIIFKKIADHLGYYVSVGRPIIHHTKASNKYTNLIKEAPGIKANEYFWQIIDQISLTADNSKNCMIEIGEFLQKDDAPHNDQFENDYLKTLGKAIVIWAGLF